MLKLHKTVCIHGNLICYRGFGILITGTPGSGKSWLSAYFISKGAELIADDMVTLYQKNSICHGSIANPTYRGILYLRNTGFIAVPSTITCTIPIHAHILLSSRTKLKISGSSQYKRRA